MGDGERGGATGVSPVADVIPTAGVLVEALHGAHGAGAGGEGAARGAGYEGVVDVDGIQGEGQRFGGAPVGTGTPHAPGHDGRALYEGRQAVEEGDLSGPTGSWGHGNVPLGSWGRGASARLGNLVAWDAVVSSWGPLI